MYTIFTKEVVFMKNFFGRLLSLCLCITILTVCFLSPVTLAASGVYELAFDNLFLFEQWANHPNLKVNNSSDDTIGTLTTDIENGSFVLVNNTSDNEVFTSFSMTSVGAFYSMPVEESTEYILSYEVNGTTTDFEAFIFFFDDEGLYQSLVSVRAYQYGLNECSFTTPENIKHIQVRFDNNTPKSNATVSNIRICAKEVYEHTKNNTSRKIFTYSASTKYGELPVPQRESLVFAGWFTGPDGTGKKITSDSLAIPASRCLYSKWDPIVDEVLNIVSLPQKQNYTVGESLNTRGLVIGVTYPDGTKENIDEGFYCSPEVLTQAGTQTILVTYGNGSTEFTVNVSSGETKEILINNSQKTVNAANHMYTVDYSGSSFNQYEINYSSDCYVKGELNFSGTIEEFFLEPAENGKFTSYIDGFLDGKTQSSLTSVSFTPLDKEQMNFTLTSINLINTSIPQEDENGVIPLSNSSYKIGIDLQWGGSLTYMEDLANNVVAAKNNQDKSAPVEVGYSDDFTGTYKSGCDTLDIYEKKSNINLINAHDTGRLVQQSYYGTGSYPYEPGMYGEAIWNYNPVQGGNLYNEPSKIVDLKVTTNEIYIKCRPLDWAKTKEFITPTYMEAWYTLENGLMRATCRFVDFSGYPSVTTTQELPAFYCVEPLNKFVYYQGGDAWSDSNKPVTKADLGFWGTATDQDFICNENWGAFVGNGAGGYGIGIYTPGQTLYHTGVYYGGDGKTHCSTTTPATEDPTSYIGVVDTIHFQSYQPISYCYYITTGNVTEIRNSFKALAQIEEDFCNGTYTNGFCDMCGRYEKATLTTDKYDLNEDGAKDNVYEIANAGQLLWFKDTVNSGATTANAVLTTDIVVNDNFLDEKGTADSSLVNHPWSPIGTQENSYNGIFHGQGHTISGLYFSDFSTNYAGLFGNTSASATIKELGVTNSYIAANNYVGSICGYNGGTIINCFAKRNVINASTYAGGITGANANSVSNCYSTASVYASSYVGGISGSNTGTVSNCYYVENSAYNSEGTVQNGIGSSIDVANQTSVKTLDEFHSGEVAYLLQKYNSDQIWGQKSNTENSSPIFNYDGQYKVNAFGFADCYSVAQVGDVNNDNNIDVSDYQQLTNMALSDSAQITDFRTLMRQDLVGDGCLDVLDCAVMALLVNGLRDATTVYHVGDFDCDGIVFTKTDIASIKKGLINQNTLTPWQKYACDLNSDGRLDINDRDILIAQEEKSTKDIFIDMTDSISTRTKTANVIILCGQSNAYGASPLTNEVIATVGNTDFSNIKIKYNNINSADGSNNWTTYFSNNQFETFRLGIGGQGMNWFGPELGFSYHIANTDNTKDEMWYIIKYTAAGTFLGGNWIYDTNYNNATNSQNIHNDLGGYLSDLMVNYVNTALDEIAAIHGADRINIRSFMWHQGESDSCVKEWADQYGSLQSMLVNKVRTAFGPRDSDNTIGFVDGGIAAYDTRTFDNPLTGSTQTYNGWAYSDTVNTHKSDMAALWYVPTDTDKNIINTTTAGLYQNTTNSTKLQNSIWVDTSTCKSKYVNNNENGEYDGAHYCGESMFRIGIWYAQGVLTVSDYS